MHSLHGRISHSSLLFWVILPVTRYSTLLLRLKKKTHFASASSQVFSCRAARNYEVLPPAQQLIASIFIKAGHTNRNLRHSEGCQRSQAVQKTSLPESNQNAEGTSHSTQERNRQCRDLILRCSRHFNRPRSCSPKTRPAAFGTKPMPELRQERPISKLARLGPGFERHLEAMA